MCLRRKKMPFFGGNKNILKRGRESETDAGCDNWTERVSKGQREKQIEKQRERQREGQRE